MTPLPAFEGQIQAPVEQPNLQPMDDWCAHPKCWSVAQHRHHAIARSWQRRAFGLGVFDFLIIEGTLSRVIVDLCATHHDRLESQPWGCKSRLRWAGGWMWYDRVEGEIVKGQIIYSDPKSGLWVAKGFCKGDYRVR